MRGHGSRSAINGVRSKQGSEVPLNSNRNNNRRRGGGRNNNRGGGNPMQNNRIDSRARGNAPQMLDKYKKLAHEAQLNDDRVQTEYYLQFADHYFRVLADAKAQKEEAQAKRAAERGDQSDDSSGDDEDDNRGQDGRGQDGRGRQPRRNTRQRRDEPQIAEGAEGESGDQQDEDNPFTRDAPKPKAARKPRKKSGPSDAVENDGSLDPDMLPPAIARANDGDDDGEKKPAKPRARRRPKDDGEEALEAVG
ncbi:DUF4167 domain-containing protein [Aurantiacibacter aquimixticola]|uniref:DUF4167 domain-containing protein n=1 Tax=Aurantiacibacter aquimixticola TaxID=1958945 RepID=A0A419RX28_9SPHN|nr:DUF4167 domain-containing protein [Aurantiacibacter aquimixticola]